MRSPRSSSGPGVVHFAIRERRDLGILGVAQFVEQQRAQRGGHVGLHLEPHHFAEPALEHLLLDHREQVFRLLAVRDLEIRVARDAERVRAEDLHPREQRAEMRADHLLERHEVIRAPLDRHPAREGLRHLHAGEMLVARARARAARPRARATGSRCTETDAPDRPRAASARGTPASRRTRRSPRARRRASSAIGRRRTPCAASAGSSSSCRQRRACSSRSPTRRSIASSCSRAVRPSGGVCCTRAATCRRSPATRTM